MGMIGAGVHHHAKRGPHFHKLFQNKTALFVPGARGLSTTHAEELANEFLRAGGRVLMPEGGNYREIWLKIGWFIVNRSNFHEIMSTIDYLITPKTRSLEKDLDRVHDKLKRGSSRKAFLDILEGEGAQVMIVAPEWLEKCFNSEQLDEPGDYLIRAPVKPKE